MLHPRKPPLGSLRRSLDLLALGDWGSLPQSPRARRPRPRPKPKCEAETRGGAQAPAPPLVSASHFGPTSLRPWPFGSQAAQFFGGGEMIPAPWRGGGATPLRSDGRTVLASLVLSLFVTTGANCMADLS